MYIYTHIYYYLEREHPISWVGSRFNFLNCQEEKKLLSSSLFSTFTNQI